MYKIVKDYNKITKCCIKNNRKFKIISKFKKKKQITKIYKKHVEI